MGIDATRGIIDEQYSGLNDIYFGSFPLHKRRLGRLRLWRGNDPK